MPNAKHDEKVIMAAQQLEFVVQTSGLIMEGSSFEEHLVDLLGGDSDITEEMDQERRQRIGKAWDALGHALGVRQSHLSEHDDVLELEIVAVRAGPTDPGYGEEPRIALKTAHHMLILDDTQVLSPLEWSLGDTIQMRVKRRTT